MTTWTIDQLLPHAGRMIWLDRVVAWDAESIVCERTVRPGAHSVQPGGLPAWAGIELMAQAIAAWNGCQVLSAGGHIRPGFLLGTRGYRSNVAYFPIGGVLRVHAVRVFHDDDGMGSFTCRIDAAGVTADARLTVFSPPDPAPFLDPHNPIDPKATS
ncbi:hotdog family protein [Luteibacter sp. PPL201]|uniref:Hotdog family protein n=1 Tax=Luteibacter sahnii TaxID=3021977 RepID=A0ABT6BB02_9GAMM